MERLEGAAALSLVALCMAVAPAHAKPLKFTCDTTLIEVDTGGNLYRLDNGSFTPMSWSFDGEWLRVAPADGRRRLGFDVANGDLLMGEAQFEGVCRAHDLQAVLALPKSRGSAVRSFFVDLPEADRRQVQEALRVFGGYDGAVDGLWGSGTLEAMLSHVGGGVDIEDPAVAVRTMLALRDAGACLASDADGVGCAAGPTATVAFGPPQPAPGPEPTVAAIAVTPVTAPPYQAASPAAAIAAPVATAAPVAATAPAFVDRMNAVLAAPSAPAPEATPEVRVAAVAPAAPALAPAPAPAHGSPDVDLAELRTNLSDDRTRVQRDAFWSSHEGRRVTLFGRVDEVRPETWLEPRHVRLLVAADTVVICIPESESVDFVSINIGDGFACTGTLDDYTMLLGVLGLNVTAAELQRR